MNKKYTVIKAKENEGAMKQYSIFDEEMIVSKRLVKSDLNNLQWSLLKYLKQYALGSKNAVKGRELAYQFNLKTTAEVRKIIKQLRTSPQVQVVIGSNSNGYFIPFEDEYIKSISLMLNKTLSMVETAINLFPASAEIIHKAVGYHYKKRDKGVHNQAQLRFNNWERELINRYAEKYKGVEK